MNVADANKRQFKRQQFKRRGLMAMDWSGVDAIPSEPRGTKELKASCFTNYGEFLGKRCTKRRVCGSLKLISVPMKGTCHGSAC